MFVISDGISRIQSFDPAFILRDAKLF